jgi:hypothetical protein
MLSEDGTGTQKRESGEREEKLSAVFATFRVTLCCRKMERVCRRERVEKERKSFRPCLLLLELHFAAGRWNGYAGEREWRKREQSFQSCLLLLELQYAAGKWNGYAGERVEKERAKLSVVLVTLCRADGRWNRLQKRERYSGAKEIKL